MKNSDQRIEGFLAALRQESPHFRIHQEEDDWMWREQGMKLMHSGDFQAAEKKFKELILAQPKHHDGYEGLALVYQKLGRKEEALFLIEHALTLARGFFVEDTLDKEVLDEIEEEKRQILEMK